MTAFATKANQSTHQNIANVFGVKALVNLMPLDLRLSLQSAADPENGDGNDRQIHVVGHISRPAWGEGRQAPDRQMFFVNGRPCNLPQVVKAINEVYKTYNASQTPFVFADFKMDLNAYDVNVSPDKRTILLHDQTAMLDSLKKQLNTAFEARDHTIPLSRLENGKLPTYKQLSIRRESADHLVSSSTPLSDSTSGKPGSNSLSLDTAVSDPIVVEQEEGPSSSEYASIGARFASTNRLLRTHVSNRTTERTRPLVENSRGSADERPVRSVESNTRQFDTSTSEQPAGSEGPPCLSESTRQALQPGVYLPQIVSEFNRTMMGPHEAASAQPSSRLAAASQLQDPIAAVQATILHQNPPEAVRDAFSRMRGLQTKSDRDWVAITIGNHTTVDRPQSPNHKRRKPNPIQNDAGRSYKANPLAVSHLRGFRATGSQVIDDDEQAGENNLRARLSARKIYPVDEECSNRSAQRQSSIDGNSSRESTCCSDGASVVDEDSDGEYVDEAEKHARENDRVARMIAEVENTVAHPTEDVLRRVNKVLKSTTTQSRKDGSLGLSYQVVTDAHSIADLTRGSYHNGLPAPPLETQQSDIPAIGLSIEDEEAMKRAEDRLNLTVDKDDFQAMKVAGQFNLGFIIAVRPDRQILSPSTSGSRRGDELFIIDQHASDEIRNFERLSNESIIKSQPLVKPRQLELTAADEEVVMENQEIFAANGWKLFVRDEDQQGKPVQVGKRCWLTEVPVSRGYVLSDGDFSELVALCQDQLGSKAHIPRPTKVRKILAMRACRSSIMIGSALTKSQMAGVLKRMSGLDKPWRCPHGRPTMRHLTKLSRFDSWKGDMDSGSGDDLRGDMEQWLRREGLLAQSQTQESDVEGAGEDELTQYTQADEGASGDEDGASSAVDVTDEELQNEVTIEEVEGTEGEEELGDGHRQE